MEGRRPHAPPPSTILRMLPLSIRCANGEETRTAHNPPIASISRADNPLTLLTFQDKQRHEPSALSRVPDSSHPVGGEGVGSSAPMSAGCGRAMKPGGWIPRGSLRRSMDGLRLLAARFPRGLLTKVMSAARRRQQCLRRDPVRSELRATTRKARGKRLRGAGLLRRNGNSTPAPGEARPPRALPDLSGSDAGGRRRMDGRWLVASGQWLAIAAHLSAEGRRRRPPHPRHRPATSH